MYLLALDFWTVAALGLIATLLVVAYRFTWWLAHFSEGLIVSLARMGLHRVARTLLVMLIGYDEQIYHRSRFIVWNQVHVRFFVLWAASFSLTGLTLLFEIRPVIWGVVLVSLLTYRVIMVLLNPAKPPIHTQDPALKQLIQDVNEPRRSAPVPRPAQPMIRRWDYLDELFSETA